ncbi:hypothetical protein DPMN_121859 [Dreissena polymorpha]|uniref:Uncharacterized protein n=1 Tax=Dreissena polymorpha TaxID=45954 RepID=A0A9D4JPU8_DREPO|nr:hypothetical protein DPMN_121859 [Dreissena polymorpha]
MPLRQTLLSQEGRFFFHSRLSSPCDRELLTMQPHVTLTSDYPAPVTLTSDYPAPVTSDYPTPVTLTYDYPAHVTLTSDYPARDIDL